MFQYLSANEASNNNGRNLKYSTSRINSNSEKKGENSNENSEDVEEEAKSDQQKFLLLIVLLVVVLIIILMIICLCNLKRFMRCLSRTCKKCCPCYHKKNIITNFEEGKTETEATMTNIQEESRYAKKSRRNNGRIISKRVQQPIRIIETKSREDTEEHIDLEESKGGLGNNNNYYRDSKSDRMKIIRNSFLRAGNKDKNKNKNESTMMNPLPNQVPEREIIHIKNSGGRERSHSANRVEILGEDYIDTNALGSKQNENKRHTVITHLSPNNHSFKSSSPVVTTKTEQMDGGAVRLTIKRKSNNQSTFSQISHDLSQSSYY